MTSPAVALAALALLLPPTNLKLEFAKGQSNRMRTVEIATTTQIDAAGKSILVAKRTTTSNSVRKVLSVDGGAALIETRTIDGETKSETAAGNSAYIVKPNVLRYRLDAKSATTKPMRPAIPGVQEGKLTFLDGFSTPLPPGPVDSGATWSGSILATGLDGKPMKVAYKSKYVGESSKNGLSCWQIDTVFQAPVKLSGTQGALKGGLRGSSTAFVAGRLGIEVEAKTLMALELTTQPTDPKVKPITTKTEWNIATLMQK